jgi:hypothetical protein
MYGIVIGLLGIVAGSIIIYGIGFGLFIDELTYLLMRGKTHEDNYSKSSLIGTIILLMLMYLFRDYLILPMGF